MDEQTKNQTASTTRADRVRMWASVLELAEKLYSETEAAGEKPSAELARLLGRKRKGK